MNRLHISTRSAADWRSRLAHPQKQWKRGFSAFETAVSWELAARSSGFPAPIEKVLKEGLLAYPELVFAVAEHKVQLRGRGGDSQCDLWGLAKIGTRFVSFAVEAKAQEAFGTNHEPLARWLLAGTSPDSKANRLDRWRHIRENLPTDDGQYGGVPFQLLHRSAAAVIEARRLGLTEAVFLVQAFNAPSESFDEFAKLSIATGNTPRRGALQFATVGELRLGLGWVDCPFATDKDVAACL